MLRFYSSQLLCLSKFSLLQTGSVHKLAIPMYGMLQTYLLYTINILYSRAHICNMQTKPKTSRTRAKVNKS